MLGGRRGDGFREVRGEEAVEYLFVIPEDFAPRRARVRALVANDYRIEVAQQHPFFDALRNQFTPRNTAFETRVRATGEVRDFSNRRAVEFEHGFATGQTIFGFDAAATFVGLKVRGEYQRNLLYRSFPVLRGRRASQKAAAWYVHALKDVGRWEVGGEALPPGAALRRRVRQSARWGAALHGLGRGKPRPTDAIGVSPRR